MNLRSKMRLFCYLLSPFVFLLLSSLPSAGMEISFLYSAGLNSASFSLVNRSLRSWTEKLHREAALQGWEIGPGSIPEMKNGLEMEAGIQVSLSSRLALSLTSGFIHFELNEKDTSQTVTKGMVNYIYAKPTKASAVPVSLNLIYFVPLHRNLRLYFRGGSGIIFARYIDREANRKESDLKFVYPTYQNASAASPLFLGAIGIHIQPEATMGFSLEITYRLVKATNFEGENKAGLRGPLEYYEEYSPQLDFWQARVVIVTSEPEEELVRSRQRSVIDFSGFSFKIGVTARF